MFTVTESDPLCFRQRLWNPEFPDPPMLNLWQGPHGRFANELFHYFFAHRLAARHQLELHTPQWWGQQIFGIADPPLVRRLPVVAEHDPRPAASPLWRSLSDGERVGNICPFGNFQFHTSLYDEPEKILFHRLFSPTPRIRDALAEAFARMTFGYSNVVAVHLRRGDYSDGHPGMFYRTPIDSVKVWLKKTLPALHRPLVYIASDDPSVEQMFNEFNVASLHTMLAKSTLPCPIDYIDFWVLSRADTLCISNSSYSFAAAMLNSTCSRFVRPAETGEIFRFEPWNADVLLRRYDPLGNLTPW